MTTLSVPCQSEHGGARGGAPISVCIGIATRGRAGVLASAIAHLRGQTLQPTSIIVSCTGPEDVAGLNREGVTVLVGPPGGVPQRNAILRAIPAGTEVVVFFDDDFFPRADWLAVVCQRFAIDPTLAAITGNVVADGILGPGFSPAEALDRLKQAAGEAPDWIVEGFSPYGCNMAFRRSAIEGLFFDERLKAYSWLEDRDFGATVARERGRMIKLGAAIGVHCGVKSGRGPGKRLGYSQVMNPAYMVRKGTMSPADAFGQVFRNIAANTRRSIRPESFIDRRGRLRGNLLALIDLVRGRLTPERVEQL